MARFSLGRIIEWAKNGDVEEVHYVHDRIALILKQRRQRVDAADGLGKVKRAKRHRDKPEDVRPLAPEQGVLADRAAGD